MSRPSATLRHARASISELMDLLVARRLARDPGISETEIRSELWRALAEHAGVDPNRIDRRAAETATWVLLALLELDVDGSRRREG